MRERSGRMGPGPINSDQLDMKCVPRNEVAEMRPEFPAFCRTLFPVNPVP
ncbi:hypothetical protein ACVIIV_004496 [Bradyrhizobium sp. USDA 4354]